MATMDRALRRDEDREAEAEAEEIRLARAPGRRMLTDRFPVQRKAAGGTSAVAGGPAPAALTVVAPYEPALHTDLTGSAEAAVERRDESAGAANGSAAALERLQAKAASEAYRHLAPFVEPLLAEARERIAASGATAPVDDLIAQLAHLLGPELQLEPAGSSAARAAVSAYHAQLAAEIEDALGELPGSADASPEERRAEAQAHARRVEARFAARLEDGVGLAIEIDTGATAAVAGSRVRVEIAARGGRGVNGGVRRTFNLDGARGR